MEYQQPLPHNKESGCAPNIRFQWEYSCKDGCRFIKTCSVDTIRCWIATSKEALLIQNSNHKVTQASANCLAFLVSRPSNSQTVYLNMYYSAVIFPPSIICPWYKQPVCYPASPSKITDIKSTKNERVPIPIKPICSKRRPFR
jgi:hypothetical protein